MPGKRKQNDARATLPKTAPSKTVMDLVARLTATRPDIRRECFDYLKKHVPLSPQQKKQSEGEVLLALWSELAPDLDELDEYGGGDYAHWPKPSKRCPETGRRSMPAVFTANSGTGRSTLNYATGR